MHQKKNNCSPARRIAVGGVFSGLSYLILLGGGFMQIATFAAPAMAGLCLIPVAYETNGKTAVFAYLAVSGLAIFTCPDKELALFYCLLFGYYPILAPGLQRLKSRFLRLFLKVLLMNGSTAAVYLVMIFVITSAEIREEFTAHSLPFLLVLLALANATFFVYDRLVDRLRVAYICHFRKKIFRC